jgi:hypothetical protein
MIKILFKSGRVKTFLAVESDENSKSALIGWYNKDIHLESHKTVPRRES